MLLFLSCTNEKQQTIAEKKVCPVVFFSKEHKIYVTGNKMPLKIENISYSAELNNYFFEKECLVLNNVLSGNISLLFVIKPENIIQEDILLPFYIAVLSPDDEILDIQYYSTQGVMQKDPVTFNYVETELTDNIRISIQHKDLKKNLEYNILIGFMLDQEKIKILN